MNAPASTMSAQQQMAPDAGHDARRLSRIESGNAWVSTSVSVIVASEGLDGLAAGRAIHAPDLP